MKRARLLATVLLGLMFPSTVLLPSTVLAQTLWYVDDDTCPRSGTGSLADPFCSIQDAIARAGNGDTVIVFGGEYQEYLDFSGKSLHVMSMDGPSDTCIVADESGLSEAMVTFRTGAGEHAILEGFTIRGGFWGIRCEGASPTIRNNVIENGKQGVYLEASEAVIEFNTIRGNSPLPFPNPAGGSGIYCTDCVNVTIRGNRIERNSSGSGGGIASRRSSVWIVGNEIVRNSGAGRYGASGGGISCIEGESVLIEENLVSNNALTVGDGGSAGAGISVNGVDEVVIRANRIEDNRTTFNGSGGGIRSGHDSEVVIVEGNRITGNFAARGGGFSGKVTSFVGNIVSHNEADTGGGLDVIGSGLLVNNWIVANTASEAGGGIQSNGAIRMANCTIAHNTAGVASGGASLSTGFPGAVGVNLIVWGNEAPTLPQISSTYPSTDLTYSNIEGGWPGEGNLAADPRFVSPSDSDYRLELDSPCIDRGTARVPMGFDTDFEGDPRPADGDGLQPAVIDIGADERVPMLTPRAGAHGSAPRMQEPPKTLDR